MTDDLDPAVVIDPDAAHLDDFRAPDIGMDEGLEDDVQRPDEEGVFEEERAPVAEPMDREAFWIVFSTAFAVPGMFWRDFAPLAIQPDEEAPARAASDAAYALLEIYYPRALLPAGDVAAHILVLAPFLLAKATIVAAILQARKMPPPRDVTPSGEDGDEPEFKTNRETPVHWMDAEEGAA